ncbi:MAG: phosphatase PAP2 family protein [Prevotella sp.]|nr:phosphatase PAP2 family protein [Prevotella sp.]MBR5929818.1 phosphatase PAP2 family protein [Prevotella sp.]
MSIFTAIDQQILFWLNGSDSLFTDGVISTLTAGTTWIPLYIALFYLVLKNNETMAQVLLTVGCAAVCVLVTAGITNLIIKPLVARPRPCDDPLIKYTVDVVSGISAGNYSFFSAHAANTSALVMFLALLIRNRLFIVAMIIWSLLNCYTRLYLGVHYPSDILCGLLFGSLMGFIAYVVYLKIYLKISPQFHYVSSHYSSTGYALDDIDVVVCVMVLTILYAIIRSLLM